MAWEALSVPSDDESANSRPARPPVRRDSRPDAADGLDPQPRRLLHADDVCFAVTRMRLHGGSRAALPLQVPDRFVGACHERGENGFETLGPLLWLAAIFLLTPTLAEGHPVVDRAHCLTRNLTLPKACLI